MGGRRKRGEQPRGVFLSWATSNRRSSDLAASLGIDTKFVSVGSQRSWTAPLRWVAQGLLSIPSIASPRTTAIVLMLPPYPALVVCRAVARVRRVPLVIDAHSSVFEDRRFARFLPATLRALSKSELTIVTNERHRVLLEANGINVVELHNPPAMLAALKSVDVNGHVLVPASWHVDEPITTIVDVARQCPRIPFVITGRPSTALRAEIEPIPPNVRLTGFVSDEEYIALLDSAAVVCCLTLNDNTMQMGGYEAMAKGLPLVTSDFGLLRAYFGDAAEYAEPTVGSIVASFDRLFADFPGFVDRMNRRRSEVDADYEANLQPVRVAINR